MSVNGRRRLATLLTGVVCVVVCTGLFETHVHMRSRDFQRCRQIDPAKADSQWAVLYWFANVYQHPKTDPGEKDAARKGVAVAEQFLFARWARKMADASPFLVEENGSLRVERLRAEASPPGELRAVMATLQQGVVAKPDLQICWEFSWIRKLSADDDFPGWVKNRNHRLTGLQPRIDAVVAVLNGVLQGRLKLALGEIDGRLAEGRLDDAFARLQRAHAEWGSAAEPAGIAERVEAVASRMIRHQIRAIREKGFDTTETNTAAEASLRAREAAWADNPFLRAAAARPATRTDIEKLRGEIGGARGRVWAESLRRAAEQKRYWTMFQTTRKRLDDAAQFEAAIADPLAARVQQIYAELLPEAAEHLLEVARDEAKDAERYGVAIVVSGMIREMMTFQESRGGTIPAECRDVLASLERLEREAHRFVRNYLTRDVMIEEFEPKGGLGTEFKQDLDAVLETQLEQCPVLHGVKLEEFSGRSNDRDYVVRKGIFPDLDAAYNPPVTKVEVVRVPGAVVEVENPEFVRMVRENRVAPGTPARVFRQQVHVFVVESVTTVGAAMARVRYIISHADEDIKGQLHLTAGLTKSFTRRQVDPTKTKIELVPHEGPASTGSVQVKPPTSADRIWSLLELKEWARKEAVWAMVMRILRLAADYPRTLEKRALAHAEVEDWRLAANAWGICLEYLRHVDTTTGTDNSYFRRPDVPRHLASEYEDSAEVLRELERMNGGDVREAAVAAVLRFLEPE